MEGSSQHCAEAASEGARLDPPQGGSNVAVDCPVQKRLTPKDQKHSTDVGRVYESTSGEATGKTWRKLLKSDTADILEKYSMLADTKDLKRMIPDSEVHELLSYVLDDHRKSIKRMREDISVLQEENSIVLSRYEHYKETLVGITMYTESLKKLIDQSTHLTRAFQVIGVTSRLIFDTTEQMLAGLHGLEEEGFPACEASVREVQGTIIDKCSVASDGYLAEGRPVYW